MMSAPTEPASGNQWYREKVTITGEDSRVRLIRYEDDLDLVTADGLAERGCAAISGGTRPQHGIVVPAVLAGPASSARGLPGHLRHRRAWRQAQALSAAPVPQAGPCAW